MQKTVVAVGRVLSIDFKNLSPKVKDFSNIMNYKKINFGLITLVIAVIQVVLTILVFIKPSLDIFFFSFLLAPIVALLVGIVSMVLEKNDNNRKKLAIIGMIISLVIPIIIILSGVKIFNLPF